MTKSIQLLYKSFYDKAFTHNYIKNGKGSGTGFLGFLSLITILITVALMVFQMRVIYNTQEFHGLISNVTQKLPPLVLQDGEMQLEKNFYQEYYYSDFVNDEEITEDDDIIILVIDSENANPTFAEIKNSVMYLTKTAFYVHNPENGEVKSLEFKEFNKTLAGKTINLTSDETISLVVKYSQIFINGMFGFLIVFGFLFGWLGNSILAILTRFLTTRFNDKFEKIEINERKRAAAAGITPAIIFFTILSAFYTVAGSIQWFFIIAIGIMYMNKYTFDGNEPAEKEK